MVRRALLAVATLLPTTLLAQQPSMTFGGFVDTYLAWDSGRPQNQDRQYTTQAARHAEFNLNLGFIDAILMGDRIRGRLALQAGTSVQVNYANEPVNGAVSGPSLAQHIQEAVVGVRMSKNAWVDAGIFLAHVGSETWVSRDNPTYTRSLTADFSPYYESGAKLTWKIRPDVTALVTIVNGWQNISENNADKSAGVRLDWQLSPRISLGYYNLIGNEQPDTIVAKMRFYNGMTARWATNEYTVVLTLDGGRQDAPNAADSWWGATLLARAQTTERTAFTGRAETFQDPQQIIAHTGVESGFRAYGGSIGFDYEPSDGVVWRSEFRALKGIDPIFIDRGAPNGRNKGNSMFVTSLAVTF